MSILSDSPRPHADTQPHDGNGPPGLRSQGGANGEPPNKIPEAVVRYVVLMLGLWTLLSYFFHTEYFPVIDLNTATSLLVSLVFVTVPLTAALSLTFLSTYLFAGLLIRARPTRRGNQNFIHELGSWTFFTGLGQCASGLIVVFYSLMEWPDGWALLAYASCGSRDLH